MNTKSTLYITLVLISIFSVNKPMGIESQKIKKCARRKLNRKLRKAIINNNLKKIETLLEKGANPNIKIRHMITPLVYAVYEISSPKMVELLLKYKVDVNDYYKSNEYKAIHLAIRSCNICITNLLIDAKADINIQDCCGNASLHFLNIKHRPETSLKLLPLLLNHGGDVNIKNFDNKSFLDLAQEQNKKEIFDIIKEHQKLIIKKIAEATKYCLPTVLENMIGEYIIFLENK